MGQVEYNAAIRAEQMKNLSYPNRQSAIEEGVKTGSVADGRARFSGKVQTVCPWSYSPADQDDSA